MSVHRTKRAIYYWVLKKKNAKAVTFISNNFSFCYNHTSLDRYSLVGNGGGRNGYIIIPNGWYVYALVYYYLCFALLQKHIKSPSYLSIALFFASLIWIATTLILGMGDWWWKSCISFNVGTLFALKKEHLIGNMRIYKRLWMFLVVCIIPYLFEIRTGSNIFFKVFENLFPLLVAMIPSHLVSYKKNNFCWLHKIGELSYEIYLIHGLVILFVKINYPHISVLYVFLIVLLLTLFLSYSINCATRKIMQKI